MGVESTQAEVGFPLAGWAMWTVAPAVAVGVLACALDLVRPDGGFLEAGVLAFASVFVGAFAGALLLAQSGVRIPGAWGGVLLISQGIRMVVSLFSGLGVFLLARPDALSFWSFFLGVSAAVLAGEVAFVLKWIRTADRLGGREER